MKKLVISAALLAVLSGVAVSCQKETVENPQAGLSEIVTVRTVSYAVNGVAHTIAIRNDDEWHAFMLRMMALAEEGNAVRIFGEKAASQLYAAKERLEYKTKDKKALDAWVLERVLEGYDVTVTYNSQTGEYTAIAIR